jgi:carboxyl-terminal processing protease
MNIYTPRTLLACFVVALLGSALVFLAPSQATIAEPETGLLAPKTEHRFASRLATRFISGYHYHRREIGEDLSSRIFDQYLRLLDGNRLYFNAGDIADLERYRPYLHDALQSADLEPAFDIFNRYVRRVGERTEFAISLLDEGLISALTKSTASIAPSCPGPKTPTNLTRSGARGSRTTGCC